MRKVDGRRGSKGGARARQISRVAPKIGQKHGHFCILRIKRAGPSGKARVGRRPCPHSQAVGPGDLRKALQCAEAVGLGGQPLHGQYRPTVSPGEAGVARQQILRHRKPLVQGGVFAHPQAGGKVAQLPQQGAGAGLAAKGQMARIGGGVAASATRLASPAPTTAVATACAPA